MPQMTAAQLSRLLGATPAHHPEVQVRGASHHSERIRAQDAFFALPGAREHGIAHADAALARGAALVVSDRPHPRGLQVADPGDALLRLGAFARARLRGPLVAVTGSAGKTTAKGLVAAATGGRAGPGNLNTPWALAGLLVRAWADGEAVPQVLELGIDRVGEMDELVELVRPDVGMLTVVAQSHLDGLGDLASVAREKGRLLEAAPRGLAAAGAWARLPDATRRRVVRYGLRDDTPDGAAEPAAWSATTGGTALEPTLRIATERGEVEARLPGPGTGLAESALGAVAIAHLLGVGVADAAARLADAALEPGRLQPRRVGGLLVLDDSYNSNPASARLALELLRASPGPRAAVLGDMLELGRASRELHRAVVADTAGLDRVWLVGDAMRAAADANPRAEAVDHAQAEARLRAWPRAGTVLVKASRGLRFERLVAALEGAEVSR